MNPPYWWSGVVSFGLPPPFLLMLLLYTTLVGGFKFSATFLCDMRHKKKIVWKPGINPSNHTNQLHHTDKTTTQQTPNTTTGQNAYPGHHKQQRKRNQNQTCCPPNKIDSFLFSTSQVLGTPPLHIMGNLNTELETKSKLTHEKHFISLWGLILQPLKSIRII